MIKCLVKQYHFFSALIDYGTNRGFFLKKKKLKIKKENKCWFKKEQPFAVFSTWQLMWEPPAVSSAVSQKKEEITESENKEENALQTWRLLSGFAKWSVFTQQNLFGNKETTVFTIKTPFDRHNCWNRKFEGIHKLYNTRQIHWTRRLTQLSRKINLEIPLHSKMCFDYCYFTSIFYLHCAE